MYSLSINILGAILALVAFFNEKIKLGVEGRAKSFDILKNAIGQDDRNIWFHCASLGEYEQGLPVFKELRLTYPNHKIVLTFFSPSGYEIRKNTRVADVVTYLPLDTLSNAKRFVQLVHPELSIFVKYDIWPNYLNQLKMSQLKAYLISAAFRPEQIYFKWYGRKFKKALRAFGHIFVQNLKTKNLLNQQGFENVTFSGDTRFDRTFSQLEQDNSLPILKEFKQESLCVVIGSSWPADEEILIPYINQKATSLVKFVIAPHEIKKSDIKRLQDQIEKAHIRYSMVSKDHFADSQELKIADVLIVDNIGLLSKIYNYADIAYVGGAMGHTGLHNILEPAVFGVPIVIGQNHRKFPEATEMIETAGVWSVSDYPTLMTQLDTLISDESLRKSMGSKNRNYIEKNRGAVIQIMERLRI